MGSTSGVLCGPGGPLSFLSRTVLPGPGGTLLFLADNVRHFNWILRATGPGERTGQGVLYITHYMHNTLPTKKFTCGCSKKRDQSKQRIKATEGCVGQWQHGQSNRRKIACKNGPPPTQARETLVQTNHTHPW